MTRRPSLIDLATGIASVCTVLVTALLLFRQFVPGAATTPSPQKDRPVPEWKQELPFGRSIGSANAPLTVLEYGDFECPACAAFFREFEMVRAAHPGDIRLVFRHFPLRYHRQAYPSARAAECAAGQGRFEQMYQTLYRMHDSLGVVPYRTLAARAGVLDMSRFDSCFADTARVARIEADLQAGNALEIPGTPGIIINGTMYVATTPSAQVLEKLIVAARSTK